MDQSSLIEKAQSIKKLLSEDAHQRCTKTAELILLDQFIEVDAKQFEHKTEMLSMNKCVFQSEQMVVIMLIKFAIELNMSVILLQI